MLSRVSSTELTEWMAYYSLEPFGTEVNMLGHAITSSTLANVNRGKGTKEFSPKDFMPKFSEDVVESEEGLMNFIGMMNTAFGGKDLRNG